MIRIGDSIINQAMMRSFKQGILTMKTVINQHTKHQNNTARTDQRSQREVPWKWPLLYSIVVTLFALSSLVYLLFLIEQLHPGNAVPMALLVALVLMAGAIGGCLFNMHSLVKHVDRGDFDEMHNIGYYLTPISGGVCGLIVVILLLGGVLTLGLAPEAKTAVLENPGRLMPFIAAAMIAGYGSYQFKNKLDELADTIFRTNAKKKTSKQEENIQKSSLEGGVTTRVDKNEG